MTIFQLVFALTGMLLLVSTIPAYIYIGNKLKENLLRWAAMGLGALFFPSMICLLVIVVFKANALLKYWSMIQYSSPIFALGLAAYLAYKKGLFTKATA